MTVSVIVPTLNEELQLPHLLASLGRQDSPVHEIIVADGFSGDRTRFIAEARGCRIVDGPEHPGVGRNRGAAVATGDALLFLDADVVLPRCFLRKFVTAFENTGAVAATPVFRPFPGTVVTWLVYIVWNVVMYCLQGVRPMAPGYCIMILRSVFEALGGFDERLLLSEDHDLVRRAARHGPFRVFLLPVRASTRRYQKHGTLRQTRQYLAVALQTIAGKRFTRSNPTVDYPFGAWEQ